MALVALSAQQLSELLTQKSEENFEKHEKKKKEISDGVFISLLTLSVKTI